MPQYPCCLLEVMLFKKKKDNIDESSITFAKDPIKDNSDFNICLKVTSMQRGLASKEKY